LSRIDASTASCRGDDDLPRDEGRIDDARRPPAHDKGPDPMASTVDILSQIEREARGAPAPLLRCLIAQAEQLNAAGPEAAGEFGRFLLLKLHHLLTQQQVRAAQSASARTAYLAPHLVIGEAAASRQQAA
jgi:hypothetical protein